MMTYCIETLISGKDTQHETVLLEYLKRMMAKQGEAITKAPWLEIVQNPLVPPPSGYLHVVAYVEVADRRRDIDYNPDQYDFELELDTPDEAAATFAAQL